MTTADFLLAVGVVNGELGSFVSFSTPIRKLSVRDFANAVKCAARWLRFLTCVTEYSGKHGGNEIVSRLPCDSNNIHNNSGEYTSWKLI